MGDAMRAVECIYEVALRVLEDNNIDPREIPLVTASVAHRLDAFAMRAYLEDASELREQRNEEGQVQ